MGLDFSELFGNAKDAISQAVEDVKNTGLPALEASLEKWGADKLNEMSKNSQGTVDQNVKEILNRPQDPNGIGAYISNTLKTPVVQQYGGLMIAGVVGIGVLAVLIFSKKGVA